VSLHVTRYVCVNRLWVWRDQRCELTARGLDGGDPVFEDGDAVFLWTTTYFTSGSMRERQVARWIPRLHRAKQAAAQGALFYANVWFRTDGSR
jgi:hypothetical protein